MANNFLFASILFFLASCTDPLDLVYNEPTYNNDIKSIKEKSELKSDRIIDQVNYSGEIKPGTTYREILDDYIDRKKLITKILNFYHQENTKKEFIASEYLELDLNKKKGKRSYSWTDEYNDYTIEGSIKNISKQDISLGMLILNDGGVNFIPFDDLKIGRTKDFNKKIKSKSSYLGTYYATIKIKDSILNELSQAKRKILTNIPYILSKFLWDDIELERKDSVLIRSLFSNESFDERIKDNNEISFENVLKNYIKDQKEDLENASRYLKKAEEIIQSNKEKLKIKERKRIKRQRENLEAEKQRLALLKLKNKDREDFKKLLNQYEVDETNIKIALSRYDKEFYAFNVLWDDLARLIVKNNEESGPDGYKTLKVNFKLLVNGEEKICLFNIKVPF